MLLTKNPHFLSNSHETWGKWLPLEAIIFTKFHEELYKIYWIYINGQFFLKCAGFFYSDLKLSNWTQIIIHRPSSYYKHQSKKFLRQCQKLVEKTVFVKKNLSLEKACVEELTLFLLLLCKTCKNCLKIIENWPHG